MGWIPRVAPAASAAASWPLGHPEPLEGCGSCEVRWTRTRTPWPPRRVMLGSPFLAWGFRAHEPRHVGKALSKNPSGIASSQAARPSSLTLRTRVRDQSLRRYKADHGQAPGIRKKSGRGSGFRIFRCRLIFIQGMGFG